MSAPASLPHSLVWAFLSATFCVIGCEDSLKSVSLIEETRVLGARVEVTADPERSSPQPGEQATVRLFVAAPSEPAQLSYAISVCAVSPVNTGFPSCVGAPFATAAQPEPMSGAPELAFQVPPGLDVSATPHGLVSALVCPDSPLEVDPNGVPRCVKSGGTPVRFEFDLGGPDYENHSPSITEASLTLDGKPWLESTVVACPGDLPTAVGGSQHSLGITLDDRAFEDMPRTTDVEPARETLLVSQFSSAGTLDHAFLSLRADTPEADRQVNWEAPAASADSPTLVRFYFVVRDARGGEDFATRALCVGR